MYIVTYRSLVILAAFVWYAGSVVLLLKGRTLLLEANAIQPDLIWPWIVIILALFLGGVKAKFLFDKSCRNNLARIYGLANPQLWQFFRPGFFLALALMIVAGATLSRLAHGRYAALLGVALLDLAIGFALLASSRVYWQPIPQTPSIPSSAAPQENSPGNL